LEEAIPKKQREIISFCMSAYNKVGIVRNIIDLMGDFTVQGIQIVHPNPRIQKFLRGWWKKVRGTERSERFSNLLYRTGNVVAKRSMMKITMKDERNIRVAAELQPEIDFPDNLQPLSRTIPGRYNFLSPLSLEVIGDELAMFTGSLRFALKVSHGLRHKIMYPQDDMERALINEIPDEIVEAIQKGAQIIPLDQDKLCVHHYKKDDWLAWAYPITYAILDDLILLEKMKLADLAALDGAISQIRIWKLGSLEHELFPTDAAISKLADILLSNTGGGAFDLIWGPELELAETSTDVHSFLGPDKYESVFTNIHAGLGVPPTLTGSSHAGGFTNNFISLQTLIRRLEYGRDRLVEFWSRELELVRKAMGFRLPGKVVFDRMTLSDEAAEKALVVQMVDRGLLSYETARERFGELPELETLRIRREETARKKREIPDQSGPYHDSDKMFELMKIALQKGLITPGEANLTDDLGNRRTGEKDTNEVMIQTRKMGGTTTPAKKKGTPGAGRPKSSKDSSKRATKRVTPRTSAEWESEMMDVIEDTSDFFRRMTWAKKAYDQISTILNPAILAQFDKKNLRSLTSSEFEHAETVKYIILCNMEPFSLINEEEVFDILQNGSKSVPEPFNTVYKKFLDTLSGDLSVDEHRQIKAAVYALINS
jgi:hypothetical protein